MVTYWEFYSMDCKFKYNILYRFNVSKNDGVNIIISFKYNILYRFNVMNQLILIHLTMYLNTTFCIGSIKKTIPAKRKT